MREVGIGCSLWSISRGLARDVENYKTLLMKADEPRRNDYDGRGALSEKSLSDFCYFFLETCIDQVEFMSSLLEPSELLRRIELYTRDEIDAGRLPQGSLAILRHALLSGEFARGEVASITGYKQRQARTVLSTLLKKELLSSETPKGRVRIAFPFEVREHWLPKLFPI